MKKILTEWRKFLIEQNIQNKFSETAANSLSAMSVFDGGVLEEGEAELEFVSNKELMSEQDKKRFVERFQESLYSGKRSGYLSYYSFEELSQMSLFMLREHNAGFALKGGNDIVSVHNNSSLRGLGG